MESFHRDTGSACFLHVNRNKMQLKRASASVIKLPFIGSLCKHAKGIPCSVSSGQESRPPAKKDITSERSVIAASTGSELEGATIRYGYGQWNHREQPRYPRQRSRQPPRGMPMASDVCSMGVRLLTCAAVPGRAGGILTPTSTGVRGSPRRVLARWIARWGL